PLATGPGRHADPPRQCRVPVVRPPPRPVPARRDAAGRPGVRVRLPADGRAGHRQARPGRDGGPPLPAGGRPVGGGRGRPAVTPTRPRPGLRTGRGGPRRPRAAWPRWRPASARRAGPRSSPRSPRRLLDEREPLGSGRSPGRSPPGHFTVPYCPNSPIKSSEVVPKAKLPTDNFLLTNHLLRPDPAAREGPTAPAGRRPAGADANRAGAYGPPPSGSTGRTISGPSESSPPRGFPAARPRRGGATLPRGRRLRSPCYYGLGYDLSSLR